MFGKITFFAGCSFLAYLLVRAIPEMRAHRSTRKMDSDNAGNYDLDGVSYDPHSHIVAVTGDDRIPDPNPDASMAAEVVALHTPVETLSRGATA
ncbi:MAG: hypothetical protein ACXVB9_00155 [Bdellovibrionota bacterium]